MSLFSKQKRITKSEVAKQYASHPSFADYLPWLEWSDEHNVMLLEDGRSVGALFEIISVPTEARPDAHIAALHEKIARMLSKLVPLEHENPWVMQIFVQDDLTLMPIANALQDYIAKHNSLDDPLAQKYLSLMREHFALMCRDQGILRDPMSGLDYRGKIRRLRIALYRRYDKIDKKNPPDVLEELQSVSQKFITQMRQIGVRVKQLEGQHVYDWLVRWFNPKPARTEGNVDALLKKFPYQKGRKPFGWSLSQNCFFGEVESHDHGWKFDGLHHKVMVFKELDSPVDIGVVSREMDLGQEQKYALMDKFPPGSVYTIQLTFESKQAVMEHLDMIEGAAVGKSSVIKDICHNVDVARRQIEEGHMLFRSVEAIYFRGENETEMKQHELTLQSLLDSVQLTVIDTAQELYPKDLYFRFLPFNFNYTFDRKRLFRSTYKYADDVARLLPIYGRSRGDGQNPLMMYYNRGGEVFMFDHLSRDFKMANSHMVIVGTTGAGKSVTLNNLCLTMSAVRNPRIVALEVGGSFDLTAKYLAQYGRDVQTMKFSRTDPIAVNPYAEAYKALDMVEREEAMLAARQAEEGLNAYQKGIEEEVSEAHVAKLRAEVEQQTKLATDKELNCEEDRDILNKMVVATRVMITRGEASEEKKMDPTDMSLLNRSIIHAMKAAKKDGAEQMVLTHVINSMQQLAEEEKNQALQTRLKMFALRLEYYASGNIRSQFVNKPSEALDDFDFLHVDFGFMQSASYKDLLNIVCISLLAKILAMAEANKASGRPTILIMDEAHVLFKSDMVATFVTLMAKVARKIGLWLIPCTQNIEDFTGMESKKVLSMMETWLCLALEADEVALVEKFKPLSDEMKALILDVRKYPGIYAEGVLMGKRYSGLFRNVPPRIALSLAMTEQDERTRRKEVQEEHGLTELEAVEHMAKEIESMRQEENDEKFFLY